MGWIERGRNRCVNLDRSCVLLHICVLCYAQAWIAIRVSKVANYAYTHSTWFTLQFLSRPDLFKQIHTHTDVRLALGWASVFVAGATGLYGYKVEFEKSKPVVWAGLILCVRVSLLIHSSQI